jgi:hypothetical protein
VNPVRPLENILHKLEEIPQILGRIHPRFAIGIGERFRGIPASLAGGLT